LELTTSMVVSNTSIAATWVRSKIRLKNCQREHLSSNPPGN
jgi:hypothetical protein